ncbi:DUF4129 domain-containing transglutaminase family protein [Alicyclobacillus sp. ALC3]|uniref:DUF4129 domain-containing transglutaminase family protein n=1 Tax=Alicyclobacillus sp. ALC3 TaxID=2796143 RepID=UPI0023790D23|nr:transglutaminase domain-containing protein [Alicyclobacillus sp. ALC3]WDL95476.1 transglutaminase domain-containing protein [Alicyclobacillus sp. ALC3]
MPRVSNPWQGARMRLFTGVAGGLWLWVFLGPVAKLGLLYQPQSLLPVFVVLVLAQLVPYKWVRVLAAFAVTTWYMRRYHSPANVTALRGIAIVFRGDAHDLVGLLEHRVPFSDPLQTHMFLAALCLIFWLLLYAAVRPRLWVFYNALGVLVLGVIDANTKVHPNVALVVMLLIFVAVRSISQFQSIHDRLVGARNPAFRYFAPVAAIFGVVCGLALLLPKQQAVWANPFVAVGNGSGVGLAGLGLPARKVIGYEQDDSSLGGSFVMSKTPVLEVVEPYPTYLQGQILNTYTGHGWIANNLNPQAVVPGQNFASPSATFTNNVPANTVTQQVTVLNASLHSNNLFAGYAAQQLVSARLRRPGIIEEDQNTGTLISGLLQPGDTYTVVSRQMSDPTTMLFNQSANPSSFPASVQSDLRLPSTLPARVRQLAQQLAVGTNSELGKVQSVETYLDNNEQYATQGIPVPGPHQDYVDQFLFETHKGYCNNFSTAMAVLLRAEGIPTRWVTGFSTGTLDTSYKGPGKRYIITNADAHSWVQVYFPGAGWIPFDPTPNYYMAYSPSKAVSITPPASSGTTTTAPKVKPRKLPVPLPNSGGSAPSSGTGSGSGTGTGIGWVKPLLEGLGWFAGVVLVLALLFRRRLSLFRHRASWRGEGTTAMTRAIRHLLHLLRVRGLAPKTGGVTLRDLGAVAKKCEIPDEDYRGFVTTVERVWYGGGEAEQRDMEQAKSVWQRWLTQLLQIWR